MTEKLCKRSSLNPMYPKIIYRTESPNSGRFHTADAPYCKPDQTQVFGVAREETVRISCEVVANPVGSTSFEWRFNASGDSNGGEMVDLPHDRFRSTNSKVRNWLATDLTNVYKSSLGEFSNQAKGRYL